MRGSSAGLPDTLKIRTGPYYYVLTVLDTIFSVFIVAPAVVGYWRSVWELMGIYVYPNQNDQLKSSLISTIIGMIGNFLFTVLQRFFEKNFHPDRNRLLYYLVSRLYTIFFAFICINGWRGPWQLLDFYNNNKMEPVTVIATTLVGVVALAVMRALRNISSPPFSIVVDSVKGYFEVPTMFRVSMGERTSLYILDCLFSVLVVGTLVVFVWRGAWTLLDIYLFPDDENFSAWCSLVLGYTIVGIAFLIQPLMKWICDRITGAARLLVADLFLIFSFIGTINVWRGIWNLLNLYLLPDNLELSCWITHWVCLIVLILLGCSNSILVRGVYIDAEEPAGKCVVFPCYYLRVIFQEERIKKFIVQQKQTELQSVKTIPIENNHISTINSITTEINHQKE